MFDEEKLKSAKQEIKNLLYNSDFDVMKLSEMRKYNIFKKYGDYYVLYALGELEMENLVKIEKIYRDNYGHILKHGNKGLYCEICDKYINENFSMTIIIINNAKHE